MSSWDDQKIFARTGFFRFPGAVEERDLTSASATQFTISKIERADAESHGAFLTTYSTIPIISRFIRKVTSLHCFNLRRLSSSILPTSLWYSWSSSNRFLANDGASSLYSPYSLTTLASICDCLVHSNASISQ